MGCHLEGVMVVASCLLLQQFASRTNFVSLLAFPFPILLAMSSSPMMLSVSLLADAKARHAAKSGQAGALDFLATLGKKDLVPETPAARHR